LVASVREILSDPDTCARAFCLASQILLSGLVHQLTEDPSRRLRHSRRAAISMAPQRPADLQKIAVRKRDIVKLSSMPAARPSHPARPYRFIAIKHSESAGLRGAFADRARHG
jgi:hypothetical protein